MKTYEVIIDLGSKTFMVDANTDEKAKQKALKLYDELPLDEKVDEYWVGDCTEVK